MSAHGFHEYVVGSPGERCDGCGVHVAVATVAHIRADGVVMHDLACAAAHPDAKPYAFYDEPLRTSLALVGSGL